MASPTKESKLISGNMREGFLVPTRTIMGFVLVLVIAGLGGKFFGMGKFIAIAIIAVGFISLLRDAQKKHYAGIFALVVIAVAYMLGAFSMMNIMGIGDAFAKISGIFYIILLIIIAFMLWGTWKNNVSEGIQLLALLFLFDGSFFQHFWITDLLFGTWLPSATHFVVTVFHP